MAPKSEKLIILYLLLKTRKIVSVIFLPFLPVIRCAFFAPCTDAILPCIPVARAAMDTGLVQSRRSTLLAVWHSLPGQREREGGDVRFTTLHLLSTFSIQFSKSQLVDFLIYFTSTVKILIHIFLDLLYVQVKDERYGQRPELFFRHFGSLASETVQTPHLTAGCSRNAKQSRWYLVPHSLPA